MSWWAVGWKSGVGGGNGFKHGCVDRGQPIITQWSRVFGRRSRAGVFCVCVKVVRVFEWENQGGLIECKVNYRTFAFVWEGMHSLSNSHTHWHTEEEPFGMVYWWRLQAKEPAIRFAFCHKRVSALFSLFSLTALLFSFIRTIFTFIPYLPFPLIPRLSPLIIPFTNPTILPLSVHSSSFSSDGFLPAAARVVIILLYTPEAAAYFCFPFKPIRLRSVHSFNKLKLGGGRDKDWWLWSGMRL